MNPRTALLAALPLFAACGSADGVDRDGAVFDGISEEAIISVTGDQMPDSFELTPLGEGLYSARQIPSIAPPWNGAEFVVTRFAGNNGLGFSGEMHGLIVHFAITPEECRRGRSRLVFPYTATMSFGEHTYLGCASTSDTPAKEPEAP